MAGGLADGLGFPFDQPSVWRCAVHWANKLRQQGITDTSAEDLLIEAWRTSHVHLESGRVEKPIPYVCSAIRSAALMRIRRGEPEVTVDPGTGVLAGLTAPAGWQEDSDARMLAEAAVRHLQRNRTEILHEAVSALGENERLASVWRAAIMAIQMLILGDMQPTWGLAETLSASMTTVEPWWRYDPEPHERAAQIAATRRKRIERGRPWVSFATLWKGLLWAKADDPVACIKIAQDHLRIIEIRRGKNSAGLERHIAEVERYVAEREQEIGRDGQNQ